MIEAFDAQPFQMLLHAFCEPHSAEEPAAADREIEQAGNAAHRQRTGEFLKLIELAGEITSANQCADRGAGDHADLDARFIEGPQDTDMGPAAGCATAKRERYPVFVDDLCNGRFIADDVGVTRRKVVLTISPSQHDRTPCQFFGFRPWPRNPLYW